MATGSGLPTGGGPPTAGAVLWPVPPSEATTRMFAALSPERLESERLESESIKPGSLGPESPASPERRAPAERLVGSGGAGNRGLPGQDRDDRAKQPRRMRRLALVSGLSVLLAVGVTAGGARLVAGRTFLSMEQPTTACPVSENCADADGPYAASGSGQALGETPAPGDPTGDPTGDAARNGQDDPGSTNVDQGETGRNDTGKNSDTGKNEAAQGGPAAPQATPASKGRDGDHASARTRAPSTTARSTADRSTTDPGASAHAVPRVGDAPAAVTAAPEGTDDTDDTDDTGTASDGGAAPGETTLDDTANTRGGEDGRDSEHAAGTNHTTGADHTNRTNTARAGSTLAGGDPAVRVRFTVSARDESGYTARIAVRNEGQALRAWTIRLATGGQVTAVEGADWRQQGDTLTLSSRAALAEGGTLTLIVHADGASAAPAGCVLSEGRCEVTNSGSSGRGD
ncbi:hypothetical protein [Microbispora bryophytorum]|uniref:hypothetical protein n=1 Tax=Microbispora bryophytorum TaxID=1460882 RepID=UPI00168B3E2E|nr:hypothetical protein [Microbispora bryophytorum]MBD3138010.1 hypothetical protein [Microbispora bryophytorum]